MKQACLILLAALVLSPGFAPEAGAQPERVAQRVLGPGAYIYQTRLDTATCEEDSSSGFTSSFFAAVDGVPGAQDMRMSLVNSEHWPTWTLHVMANGMVTGDATVRGQRGQNPARSHFEIQRRGDHLRGRGFREYSRTVDGETRRCRNDFDVLLRRMDFSQAP
ncbi:MAG: hypothetical protein ACI9KE_004156 [Polyangiales bacterium]